MLLGSGRRELFILLIEITYRLVFATPFEILEDVKTQEIFLFD